MRFLREVDRGYIYPRERFTAKVLLAAICHLISRVTRYATPDCAIADATMSLVRRSTRIAAMARRANYHPYARPAMALARRAVNAARSRMGRSTQSTAQSSSSAPLTSHFDYKTDYVKRRMTRRRRRIIRRRRKWSRRVVRAVRESTLGSAHIIRRSFAPDQFSSDGLSNSVSWTMYGLNGQNNPNLNTTNDIGQSMFEAAGTDWTNWTSTSLASVNHKIHAYHGTMECTIVNAGGTDALVEVYYIRARSREDEAWQSPNHVYNVGFLKQKETREPDTGLQVGTPLTPTELGVTPFQNALFCRKFNIYKRQKFRIPGNGGEVSFILHDRKPRTYTMSGVRQYAWDRGTSGILVQWQGVAQGGTFGEVSPSPALPTVMSFNITRRYRFKFARDDTPTDGRN